MLIKNIKLKTALIIMSLLVLCALLLAACAPVGETRQKLSGFEQNLPDEIKGLKVYRVIVDDANNYVYVGILNNQINSVSGYNGKTLTSTILVNPNNQDVIQIKQVLVNNDSIIVCRKK